MITSTVYNYLLMSHLTRLENLVSDPTNDYDGNKLSLPTGTETKDGIVWCMMFIDCWMVVIEMN